MGLVLAALPAATRLAGRDRIGSIGQGTGNIICTCHGSIYDPADNATVLGGPAPKRLPALPIKLDGGGQVVAKAGFTGRIGPK